MASWIPLLVRQEDYAEFAGQVAEREAERDDTTAPTTIHSHPGAAVGTTTGSREAELLSTLPTWSIENLTRLAESAATVVTAERLGRAMDAMCRHVGKFISSEQLAGEAMMPITHWRDVPRKLRSHLAKHYEPNTQFPLKGVGGRELNKDDQVYWGITPEQAQKWLQVRTQTGGSSIPLEGH